MPFTHPSAPSVLRSRTSCLWPLVAAWGLTLPLALAACAGGGATTQDATPAASLALLAGSIGGVGNLDGGGGAARFNAPQAAAIDAEGNAYVADTLSDTIRKVTRAGVVTTFAGSPGEQGSADGKGAAARFWAPTGVAIDAAGTVYVADYGNTAIRKITPAGEVSTLAGGDYGDADG